MLLRFGWGCGKDDIDTISSCKKEFGAACDIKTMAGAGARPLKES